MQIVTADFIRVCGMSSRFFARQGKKPQEYCRIARLFNAAGRKRRRQDVRRDEINGYYSIAQREAACPLRLYLFPPEAKKETRPFLAACAGGSDDLLVVPDGHTEGIPPLPGVFVAAAKKPDWADGSRYLAFADSGGPVRLSLAYADGALRAFLQSAVSRYGSRLWAELRPLRAVYPLPCPADGGEVLGEDALAGLIAGRAAFFAQPFCCMACVLPDPPARLVLFDTDETLQKKLALCRELGAANVFGCAQI
jgi:hypothetical protein